VIETVVFVPVRSNDGSPYRRSFWRTLEASLVRRFGAYSRQSDVLGVWVDLPESRIQEPGPASTYRDTSRQYVVALQSWSQFPVWLELVEWILA
jgi:hypothetical protein